MKKRNFITLILGVIIVALGFLYPIFKPEYSYWECFLTLVPFAFILLGIFITLFAILGFSFPDFFKETCPLSTTITATAGSFVGSCWFWCFLVYATSSSKNNPIAYPMSITFGNILSICLLVLLVAYIYFRIKKFYFSGLGIDVLIVILTFVPFFFICGGILEIAEAAYHSMIA